MALKYQLPVPPAYAVEYRNDAFVTPKGEL